MKKASLRFAAHPLNSSHLFLTNSYLSKNEKKTQQRDQTGEDLLQLLLSNVCSLLDQLAALLGTSAGSPAPAAVAATLCAVLAVNSAAHVAVLHVLYSALLRAVGLRAPPMPQWVARRIGVGADGSGVAGGGAGGGSDPLSAR